MRSINFLTTTTTTVLITILHLASAAPFTTFEACTSNPLLSLSAILPGHVEPAICMQSAPALSYALHCSPDGAPAIPAGDLGEALFQLRRTATDLSRDAVLPATTFPVCVGEACIFMHDTPGAGQGWTASGVADVIFSLEGEVANNQDKGDWVGCGFAVSYKDGSKKEFAKGCFAARGKEGGVEWCLEEDGQVSAS